MNRSTAFSALSPAYLRLYSRLREEIVNQAYRYGEKLPSKRNMAANSGVSTVTVEHAYALLAEEGYIESRERSGFYVTFRPDDGFAAPAALPIRPAAVPSDPSGLPPFPFSVLAKTTRRVLSTYGERILEKSPNAGCLELREALRRYLACNRGIEAELDQVVIGSGAEYLYSLIVGMLGRNRLFALESPSYEKIEQVYRWAGAACELLPLGPDGIDSRALAETKASVLHISPYRSYPTGVTATASKRHEYLRWAAGGGRVLVEDDFESEFSVSSKPEETMFSLSKGGRVIYLNTFSKTISPSLRMGYMVLPRELVPLFQEKVGFLSCTVPALEQFVLAELLAGGDFARHINRVRRAKRKGLLAGGARGERAV